MRVLITFEPYARSISPYDLLSRINCGQVVEWGRNKCIVDLSNCDSNALALIRDVNYVAHVSIIDRVINRDLDSLFATTKEVLMSLVGGGMVRLRSLLREWTRSTQ
ncbi:hypothetical protein [Vulcanisaeta sp. JCM 14467]|uniref:hypothetical protein n=1 Tax=Vulcanisaeta sp. JCM 14467 TaxID=1295370 RepID=UPI0020937620|nr:hypothetical protein [Vulcanisaeta sp. JCM 14467]